MFECPETYDGRHSRADVWGCCMYCGKKYESVVGIPDRGPGAYGVSELSEAYGRYYDPDFEAISPDQIRRIYSMGQEK